MEFNSRLIINLSIAILMLSYAGYCWIRQGVHVRARVGKLEKMLQNRSGSALYSTSYLE